MTKTVAVLRGVWMFLAFAITLVSMQYFFGLGFADQAEVYDQRQVVLWLHIGPAMLALALGPFQMWKRLRRRRPWLHRTLGWAYVASIMVSSVGGFLLASTAFGGAVSTWGFRALAVTWLATTAIAVSMAARGNYAAHRRWMIRSYAVTTAAISLRLMLPIAPILGFEFVDGYRVAAWACWLVNLAVAEIYLARRGSMSRTEWRREPAKAQAAIAA